MQIDLCGRPQSSTFLKIEVLSANLLTRPSKAHEKRVNV